MELGEKMKRSYLFLGLGILFIALSLVSFYYLTEYTDCGSACAPNSWFEGVNLFHSTEICTLQCVPGEYATNTYLFCFYASLLAFILAILYFVKERKQ